MPSKQRALLLDAAAASCPLILVVAVRTFFAPAPSEAGAPRNNPPPPGPAIAAPAGPLTPEQKKAADWIADIARKRGDLDRVTALYERPSSATGDTVVSLFERKQAVGFR